MSWKQFTPDGRLKGGQLPQGVVCSAMRTSSTAAWLAATPTKIIFDTKRFDPFGYYDTTLGRFTPKVAGYYKVSAAVYVTGIAASGNYAFLIAWKNGAQWAALGGQRPNGASDIIVSGETTIYCNGTTDYIEIAVQTQGTANAFGDNNGNTACQFELVSGISYQSPIPNIPTRQVLDVGLANQTRAGRTLAASDFTGLGLATPLLLATPGSLVNLGSGGNLVNKGALSLTSRDILGGSLGYGYVGNVGQVLYIADIGGADPFRILGGSWGCWFNCTRILLDQKLMAKFANTGATATGGLMLKIDATTNQLSAFISDGTALTNVMAGPVVTDGRYHFAVVTFDGGALRLYCDGELVGTGPSNTLGNSGASGPLNIGGYGGDAGNNCINPLYGGIYQPFILGDVLSDEQQRYLYACSISHGLPQQPYEVKLNVRRRRKGAPLATSDFSTTPIILFPFTGRSATSIGSNTIAMSGGGNTPPGFDGLSNSAWQFASAAAAPLFGSDAGLPSGLNARTYGCWFRTTATGQIFLGWGTAAGNLDTYLQTNSAGQVGAPNAMSSGSYNDGKWHFIAVCDDNSAVDMKTKVFIDGKIVTGSTATPINITLGGTAFRIGSRANATLYYDGAVDNVFICNYAMTQWEMMSLYMKSAQDMGFSPKEAGMHVERMDTSNIYFIGDTLEPQHMLEIGVAA